MNQNVLKEIKLALEVIKKRINSESKMSTFEFAFEEFIPEKAQPAIKGITNFATEIEEKNLINLFKKIEKESKGIIMFDFSEKTPLMPTLGGVISQIELRELNKPTFFIYIGNVIEFDKYQKKIDQQLKEKISTLVLLVLNKRGELYRTDDTEKKFVYPMVSGSLRHRIVNYLAIEKKYVGTAELAAEFERTPPQIKKTIAEIRKQIEKKIKIPGDKIIETGGSGGYKIKNTRIKEN